MLLRGVRKVVLAVLVAARMSVEMLLWGVRKAEGPAGRPFALVRRDAALGCAQGPALPVASRCVVQLMGRIMHS